MSITKRGTKYLAAFGSGKARIRASFDTEAAAKAWEQSQGVARALKQKEAAATPLVAPCWTLQQAFDHTLRHQWAGTGGEAVAVLNANFALQFFGPTTLVSAVVATEVLRYMSNLIERGNSPATRNKKMSALRVMLVNAIDYGNLASLPKMKRTREKRQAPQWFRADLVVDMLAKCLELQYQDLHDFIVIGLHTGFRSSELRRLTLTHYQNGAFVLDAGTTKSEAPRRVPVSATIKAIVEKRKTDGMHQLFPSIITKATLRGQWEDLRCHLGRENDPSFTPHKMRHTCATNLIKKGVGLVEVQRWLGHEVIETTMVYAHLSEGALDAANAKMEA